MLKLTELAQAIEDGKTIEVYIQPLTKDAGWYKAKQTDLILREWLRDPRDVRIAPEKKPIDLSVLSESGIDCEFSHAGNDDWYPFGGLSKIVKNRYRTNPDHDGSYAQCRPRMGGHWHNWQGGECPLPEGLVVEVMLRNKKKITAGAGGSRATWAHIWDDSDIIAFKVIAVADTHCMPWEAQ